MEEVSDGRGAAAVALAPLNSRPENLTDRVFHAIRDNIVNRTLPPGSRISEARVASQLQVSKTPVREALLRLRHVGLVEPVERGLQVIRPSVQTVRNAYELRAGLERAAAFYAAHRCDADARERLLELAALSLKAAENGDGGSFRARDREFHRLIARASSNSALRAAVDDSLVLTAALRERDVPVSGDSVVCASEHVEVAKAICAGQADKAADKNAEHVLHVMSLVLAAHTDPANRIERDRSTP